MKYEFTFKLENFYFTTYGITQKFRAMNSIDKLILI